ncbi:MAG: glycosyltransferase family 87 protein [Chloroflexota bacterium]
MTDPHPGHATLRAPHQAPALRRFRAKRLDPLAARLRRFVAAWRLDTPPSLGILVALAAWVLIVAFAEPFGRQFGTGQEARSYWMPTLAHPYANADWTTPSAYVYSPAFLQLVAPLTALPWQAFVAAWAAILLAALRFLTGPRLLALGVALAFIEVAGGNISLLLAAAIVVGFRWPAAWAFVLLTKVTPGIGLLWFAVRREWRQLGIALVATALVVTVSALMMPVAWQEWIDVLANIAGRDGTWAAVPIPFVVRLPLAVALVAWGAGSNRRWTVPVASMIALPALWYGGLTMLLAVIALRATDSPGDPSDAGPSPASDPEPMPRRTVRSMRPVPGGAAG